MSLLWKPSKGFPMRSTKLSSVLFCVTCPLPVLTTLYAHCTLTTLASGLCSLEKSQVPFHPRFPRWPSGKEPACHCRRCRRHGFTPWFRKIPQRRAWQPTPVFLPGASHGQKSLVGHSPRRHSQKRLSARARTHTHIHSPSQGLCTPLPCVWFLQGFSHAVSSTSRFQNIYIPGGPLARTLSKVGSLVSQLVSIKTPSLFIYLSLLTWNYTSIMCLSHWNVGSLKVGWYVSAFLWCTQCRLQSKLA